MKLCMQFVLGVIILLVSFEGVGAPGDQPVLTQCDNQAIASLCLLIKTKQFDAAVEMLRSNNRSYDARLLNLGRCDGLPFLHKALSLNHMSARLIAAMLSRGANAQQVLDEDAGRFFKGYTPAHIAVRRKLSSDIYGVLNAAGGDFFLGDNDGWRPIDIAFYDGNKVAVQWLAKKFDLIGFAIKKSKAEKFYSSLVGKFLDGYSIEWLDEHTPEFKLR